MGLGAIPLALQFIGNGNMTARNQDIGQRRQAGTHKKAPQYGAFLYFPKMAVREGFEPSIPF